MHFQVSGRQEIETSNDLAWEQFPTVHFSPAGHHLIFNFQLDVKAIYAHDTVSILLPALQQLSPSAMVTPSYTNNYST